MAIKLSHNIEKTLFTLIETVHKAGKENWADAEWVEKVDPLIFQLKEAIREQIQAVYEEWEIEEGYR
jgi:hypothetical protein